MKKTRNVIDLYLRDQPIDVDKLQFKGLQSISHSEQTNLIILSLYVDKINLSKIIKKINKIREIQYFSLWTDPQQEIAEAVAQHDHFKAFALCSSAYDYLGKKIMIKHIDENNLPDNVKDIEGLQVDDVINKLYYDFGLIDDDLREDMRTVNKIRIKFIHQKLSHEIEKKDLRLIYENIDKIKTSLDALKKIDGS